MNVIRFKLINSIAQQNRFSLLILYTTIFLSGLDKIAFMAQLKTSLELQLHDLGYT